VHKPIYTLLEPHSLKEKKTSNASKQWVPNYSPSKF
jgi:hypothetical protein